MARLAILVYGVLAYAAFLAVILYAIGFTGGGVVPKAIDDGEVQPAGLAMATDVFLLVLFGITHSTMARPAFKRALTTVLPQAAERSTFVLVASIQLAAAFWLWQPVTAVVWSVKSSGIDWLLRALFLGGWVLVFWSSFLIDHLDLFGLRQTWLNFKNVSYSHRPFLVRGPYKVVRHPLMLGFLIAFWITPCMTVGHMLFAGVMTVYILVGIHLEERDLVQHLGDDYRRYQRSTTMLIPWWRG